MKKLLNFVYDTFIENYSKEQLDEIYYEVSRRRRFTEEDLYRAYLGAGISDKRARREARERTGHID